jgi:hypothetical protein
MYFLEMFITLKCNKDNISVEQASASTAQGTRPRHAACTECRMKKVCLMRPHFRTYHLSNRNQLKCSGKREGCAGCLSNNLDCTYPPLGRGNNGAARRSRTQSQAQSPSMQTRPPSAVFRNSLTPRLSTSSPTTSIELDIDRLPWSAHTLVSSETTEASLDAYWRGSPASLESQLVEGACSVFPDTEAGHDLFLDHANVSSSKFVLRSE